MKALTLTQPWATLVAIGAKRIETRSWSTRHRGLIAIHAAKGYPPWARETCRYEPFPTALVEHLVLPTGAIVAIARLVEVYSTCDESCDGLLNNHGARPHERAFGDYSPGRYAWWFADVQRLPEPIPCRGALGLWDVPGDIETAIDISLARRSA